MLQMMADGLFYELGINTGECQAKAAADVEPDRVRFRINDLRSESHPLLLPGEALVNDTVDRLTLLNVRGRAVYNPANGNECAIVALKDVAVCEQAGLITWNQAGYLVLATSAVLRRNAAALLSSDYVAYILDRLAAVFPALVQRIEKHLSLHELTAVLRALLREEVSIRNLPLILESILIAPPRIESEVDKYIIFAATWQGIRPALSLGPPAETNALEIAEYVRMCLKQYISHKYTRGQNTLVVYLVEPKIEERLRDPRLYDEAETRELLDAVHSEVANLPPTAQNPVILTTATVRHRLRGQLQGSFPHLAVLSYQELSPDMNIQPIARISLD
jgi:type III secretion protein V